jgi:hypothetical protein
MEDRIMLRACAVAAFVFVLATPAVADAIDGDWCGGKGRHLSIRGPEITTPSGVTLKGNYDRHAFAYTVPPGDDEPGMQVYLRLLSEDFMNFHYVRDGKPGEPELWRRCEVIS